MYRIDGDEEMVQNSIHKKYMQELIETRSDVKTWKCANIGYNNNQKTQFVDIIDI